MRIAEEKNLFTITMVLNTKTTPFTNGYKKSNYVYSVYTVPAGYTSKLSKCKYNHDYYCK